MKKYLLVQLQETLFNRLSQFCKGDEKAMRAFAAKAVEKQLAEEARSDGEEKPDDDHEDLEAYLKSGKPGNRSYGAKGQGW